MKTSILKDFSQHSKKDQRKLMKGAKQTRIKIQAKAGPAHKKVQLMREKKYG